MSLIYSSKERVPSVGAADLEDDAIMRTLAHECQACATTLCCPNRLIEVVKGCVNYAMV